jgi:heme-degrading monooxygenase HmoA
MKKAGPVHVRVWEFGVKLNFEKEFEKIYGPRGGWVRIFRKAKGYRRTELLRDKETRGRFLTVDYWDSEKAYDAFRSQFAHEFTVLDRQCESLTEKEIFLGSFSISSHSHSIR